MFAHIEYMHAAGVSYCHTLQYEMYSLVDGHEESVDLGVCHGEWSATLDLQFKARQHTSAAADYVPEAHRSKEGGRISQAHNHHLPKALGRAKDTNGVHCLVSGDQHEGLHAH